MAKAYKTQKKKTALTTFLDILFKLLVVVAVILFAYIAYTNISFSTPSIEITPKKKSTVESHTPSELKWFNDFKGIENVPNKDAKKNSNSGGSSSGFKYEGFKK